MFAIVLVLIGIGLAASLLYAGTTIFQGSSSTRVQAKENMISAMYGLASAYQAYTAANGSALTAGACSSTQLVPAYLSEVKFPVSGMSCTFGTDGANLCSGVSCGDYFCYSGSVTQAAFRGFQDAGNTTGSGNIASAFPASSYYISSSACGLRANTTPGSWPSNVYVTYWLLGQ